MISSTPPLQTWRLVHHGLLLTCLIVVVCGCTRPGWESTSAETTGTAEARFGLSFEAVEFTPPEVNRASLHNGLEVYHFQSSMPHLVTVLVRVGVGSVRDPAGKVGAAKMTARLIRNGGTEMLPGDELDRELEARGARLSVESNREATWFRLSVLPEDLQWGLEALKGMLTEPALPEEKLRLAVARRAVELRQRLDVPRELAKALFPQLVFGRDHPWGWTETEQTLRAVTLEDVYGMFQRYYAASNMRLGLSGAVDWENARRMVAATFGVLAKRARPEEALPEAGVLRESAVYLVPRPTNQNVIYFGHEGVARFIEDKFAVKVFNSVLSGGFTSRLFKEVRSNRGLAYLVDGRLDEGTRRGIFYNVALTKVASSLVALDLMLEVNRSLTRAEPRPGELSIARQSRINSFVFFFDTPEQVVRQKIYLDAFGYPEDYLTNYVDNLQGVSGEQVRAAAARHLHLDRIVVLVVGRVDEAFRDRLERIGPITEIPERALREQWL